MPAYMMHERNTKCSHMLQQILTAEQEKQTRSSHPISLYAYSLGKYSKNTGSLQNC